MFVESSLLKEHQGNNWLANVTHAGGFFVWGLQLGDFGACGVFCFVVWGGFFIYFCPAFYFLFTIQLIDPLLAEARARSF